MKKLWSKIKSFLQEIKARWGSKSPYLFRIIQKLSAGLTTIAGVALVIKQFPDINLPDTIRVLADRAVIISAIMVYLVSKLPIDTNLATPATLQKIEDNKPTTPE